MRYLWGLGDLVLDARWGSRSGLNNNKGQRSFIFNYSSSETRKGDRSGKTAIYHQEFIFAIDHHQSHIKRR
ncbi:MAG: hypothetical protein EAZ90_10005 [Oscillatoriales cyanobacterium]|nr:MAG: hypothetical protein EAZ94_10685 [Oscillatoriales cyanobacterium]TAE25207.1 MAG: hypothetical protein EAZ93_10965 [Oscillatoriales cyanobacterium]TAE43579.1 MAG: hypothetical protein EAZ90_10005 [Oscillatoriales cyanobacterium]TAG95688.1 MAG: hypothetical protein EAZ19_10910 [Oscillatoriales cyanobacterium]